MVANQTLHPEPIASCGSTRTEAGSALVLRLQQSKLFLDYRRAFEASLGLPLVLREAGSFRTPLEGSSRLNPFCALMTQSNKTCASCLQLQQRVEEQATREAQTLQCYAGLSETVVPIRVGNRVLAYLQTGQVFLRAPAKQQYAAISRLANGGESAAKKRKLESAYFQTRTLTPKQYESIIQLLIIFAEHLASVSNQMLLTEATSEPLIVTKARAYIAEHQTEVLGLVIVARSVHLSAYYFCKVFKNSTGLTFTEYLARARIEAVKQMLQNANLRVSEAAFSAGFQSLSQFNRVFRRVAGEAPSNYRDRLHPARGKSTRNGNFVRAA